MPQAHQKDENKKSKLLLVEDNPVNEKVMTQVLQSAGYDVLTAVDGESALRIARRARPSLVLLDVILPGIDGYTVCRTLKTDPQTAEIPIIFMTAVSDTDSIVAAFELGAVDYITKPIRPPEALARIRTHLTLRNLQLHMESQIQERELLIADLEAFTHMVAHDLKGPIGNVVAFSELIRSDRALLQGKQIDELLDLLLQTGYKMNDIVESLLVLAGVRLQEVDFMPVDMSAVVAEALTRLTQEIDMLGAEIIVPETLPSALGVGAWIEEVWVNYLSNGLKYGGQPPVLELGGTELPNGLIQFWVRDNGPGISAEQRCRLFKPFERLNQTRVSGHGLGLSIVKRIVEKLNGTVGVQSEPNQGSTFFFILPAVEAPQEAPQHEVAAAAASASV